VRRIRILPLNPQGLLRVTALLPLQATQDIYMVQRGMGHSSLDVIAGIVERRSLAACELSTISDYHNWLHSAFLVGKSANSG
jgi:hypothetical protein